MRYLLIALCVLVGAATSVMAQVSIGIGVPGVSIGVNLRSYPELALVPGYPVYYAPRLPFNLFFYDTLYWVYQGDNWYASSWYNGPWELMAPTLVPSYILRVPVRYYRAPPVYFRGWRPDAPPRWGDHWGREWQQQRGGWDQWNRRAVPAPAPLPIYQRRYSGQRYPHVEQQRSLESQHYRYQPRDNVVRQHFQERGMQPAPSRQTSPQLRDPAVRDQRQPSSLPPGQERGRGPGDERRPEHSR